MPCLSGNVITAGPHGRVSTRHQTAKSTCWGAPCLPWGERGRWTLQVRNGTPGCDGLCSAAPSYPKCEIPRTEARWARQQSRSPAWIQPSSFWGPSSPPAPTCCLFLRGSLNIILLTGQGVEEWVIRKTVTTCGHPHWPLFRITALVASGKPFIGVLGVSLTGPRMILSAAPAKSAFGSFYISKETLISCWSS